MVINIQATMGFDDCYQIKKMKYLFDFAKHIFAIRGIFCISYSYKVHYINKYIVFSVANGPYFLPCSNFITLKNCCTPKDGFCNAAIFLWYRIAACFKNCCTPKNQFYHAAIFLWYEIVAHLIIVALLKCVDLCWLM